MSKGGRTGKHAPAEPTKRYPGFNEAGNKTEGMGEYSPTKLGFEGSGLQRFMYWDPNTKTYHSVPAHNAKEAA